MVLTIFTPRPKPEQVFTPRGVLNPKMYTQRGALEHDFEEKLRRKGHHIVLYGESGCGKTWLYNNFFGQNGVAYKVVNLADASRNGKISSELLRVVSGDGTSTLTGYSEKKAAEVSAVVAKGSLDHTNTFAVSTPDPLRAAIKRFRQQAGSHHAFIVLDNLERIFGKPPLMDELADLITLADDPEFLKEEIRFLLVGVPSGIKEYFATTPSHRTVANRLVQIQEVARLSKDEAQQLVVQGFEHELKYEVPDLFRAKLLKHVLWVTDRIPQSMQEYCLELAVIGEGKRQLTEDMLPIADRKWLGSSLSSAYAAIESQLNERDTKVQRRNQVLYVLGQMEANEFKPQHVEEAIRGQFHPGESLVNIGGVPNAFGDLTAGTGTPVLKKTPKGDAYMFVDPHYRMAIRAMLRVNDKNQVEKVAMDDIA
jgi:hypothetical protein